MVLERTSAALRLKSSVVARICQRWGNRYSTNGQGNGAVWLSASNSRYHPLRTDAIKNFVNMYYRTDPYASMTKAHDKLQKSGLFRGSQATLRRLLQKEGFDFVRTGSRCDVFKKVAGEFIFEEYAKASREEEAADRLAKNANLEPLDSLDCEKEDLEFFRCVLPSVAQLTDSDKFNFRLAVMGKVQSILYEPPPEPSPTPAATTELTSDATEATATATDATPKATSETSKATPEAPMEVTLDPLSDK